MKLEYDLETYIETIKNSKSYFSTFINKENLSAGILVLKSGEEDTQLPHDVDEVYYIISGNGFLKIKEKDYDISKGKLFFVAKNVEHFFYGNTRDLKVLYFFGGSDS